MPHHRDMNYASPGGDAAKPEPKPPLIGQPAFSTAARTPKDPLPPPTVKPDPTVVASNRTTLPAYSALTAVPTIPAPAPPVDSVPERIVDKSREPLPAKISANRSLTRVLGLKLGRVVIDPYRLLDAGKVAAAGLALYSIGRPPILPGRD